MAHGTVVGPFREFDLADEPRLDPMDRRREFWSRLKRAALIDQRQKARGQFVQRLVAESRAHIARIDELALLTDAEDKRAKTDSAFPWEPCSRK